ncbi:transposase [Lacisediminihabitans changchengi]|uniref:Transposase n=1 Tax=Lacisediminihabitans changchengi TaxID=2787634 RepID=A0A934VY66_9MICO|nr:transposase [Lacisediminihabitans changchengi]
MPKAFPLEFRREVVAVARKNEAPIAQVAKDFGISESGLQRWLKLADIEDGNRPGVTQADATELREARKRIQLLEQGNEILRGAAAYLSQASLPK